MYNNNNNNKNSNKYKYNRYTKYNLCPEKLML